MYVCIVYVCVVIRRRTVHVSSAHAMGVCILQLGKDRQCRSHANLTACSMHPRHCTLYSMATNWL